MSHLSRRSSIRLRIGLIALGLLWEAVPIAIAQVPSVNFRRPFTPLHPGGTVAGEPTSGLDAGQFHVGTWVSYADDVIEIESLEGELLGTPLQAQFIADVFVNYGVQRWLTLGALVPAVLYQEGESVDAAQVPKAPQHALGDVSLGAKVTILSPTDVSATLSERFGLAWLSRVGLPTGERTSYVGDGQVSVETRALGEFAWKILGLRASFGGYWRPTTRVYVGEQFGSALVWGGSAVLRAYESTRGDHRVFGSVDARGEVALVEPFASRAASPAFLGASGRWQVRSWAFFAGPEISLTSAVGSPRVRIAVGAEWAAHDEDTDSDGISDVDDRCPKEAEDADGDADSDGCPDLDVDGDGVADTQDKCLPLHALATSAGVIEDRDGFQDHDGCLDADNDGDGVADASDACPDKKGDPTSSRPGCPHMDGDRDGVEDANDKCPEHPEDVDSYQDGDGCPDPDNDGDSVIDADDACPTTQGTIGYPVSERGCPDRDPDRDTFSADTDRCTDSPEDFNGREDDDGCPDAAPGEDPASALVKVIAQFGLSVVAFRVLPTVVIGEDGTAHVAHESLPSLRALARMLILDRELQASVTPGPNSAVSVNPEQARLQVQRVVQRLNELAHNGEAAVAEEFPEALRRSTAKGAPFVVTLRRRNVLSE